MIVSYNWLKLYVEGLPSPQDIEEVLSMHAFEVDGVEEKDSDVLFDIKVLPNRSSDCLSHMGIARELATLFDLSFKEPEASVKGMSTLSSKNLLRLSIKDSSLCRRALKRIITDVTVTSSPQWLVELLESVGQRSINAIVDITNFVMLETGQPVHAFDYDKISGTGVKDIVIRDAKDGERIELLDDNTYELDPSILVIADATKALDVAGIKGGKHSSIDENTTRVMLSVCSFDPATIRRAGAKLNLRTDALKRFENNVPPELSLYALNRLTSLIETYAHGSATADIVDEYPVPLENNQVVVTTQDIKKLLGATISADDVEGILRKLYFDVKRDSTTFIVQAPYWRTDISIKEDVIEEVGRIYGYDKIEALVPPASVMKPPLDKIHYYSEKIRDALISCGFSEVYLYSFVEKGVIEVKNKIASDKGYLRSNLSGGIKKALEMNIKNAPLLGTEVIQIFEIGKVFTEEREYTSLALGVRSTSKKHTPSEVYKDLTEALRHFSIALTPDEDGVIEIDLEKVVEGLPEPEVLDIENVVETGVQFQSYSTYPYVLRDIAVWVPETTKPEELLDVIKKSSNDLLVQTSLFDEYKKEERVSYAYNLVFQSGEKTLTDDEVNAVMEEVYSQVKNRGWEVR